LITIIKQAFRDIHSWLHSRPLRHNVINKKEKWRDNTQRNTSKKGKECKKNKKNKKKKKSKHHTNSPKLRKKA
jgi:hypothetical protein